MTAAGNGRRHSFPIVQLAITGLLLLSIAGCRQPQNEVATGSDTPIVISGGSVHFRARRSGWTQCSTTSTNCYEATFTHSDKPTLKYYELVSDTFKETSKPVTPGAIGWEVDVWDANPGNPQQPTPTQLMKYGVLVCAEANSNFTACNPGPFTNGFPSDNIYVIAIGGSLDIPDASHPNRLEYHDSGSDNENYAYINNIYLNASGGKGGTQEPCGDYACSLFLSKTAK